MLVIVVFYRVKSLIQNLAAPVTAGIELERLAMICAATFTSDFTSKSGNDKDCGDNDRDNRSGYNVQNTLTIV